MGIFITCLLVILSPLNSILKIEIKGNRYFPKEKIICTLNLSETYNLTDKTIEKASDKLLQLYKNAGFLETEIHYERRNYTLEITILEGQQFKVGNMKVQGNKFIKDNVFLKFLGLKVNSIFRIQDFEIGVDEILDLYGNNGFPFTKIIPSYFRTENGKIDIGLKIEEGPRLKWGDIIVQGNTVTKPYVIKKQLRIPHGYYFSESQLTTSQSWLDKLPFIEVEDEFVLVKGEESGTIDVFVKLREMKSNRISGIIGYLPPLEEEKGGFIGLATIGMLNLFGTGRALNVTWEKQIPPYTKLDVVYKEPWIFGSQSSLVLSLFHLLEDTLYTFSKANIEVKSDLLLNLSLSIMTGLERFAPASIELPLSTKYLLGTGIEYTNLDYRINPRKGVNYIFSNEYGKKGSTNVMKFAMDLFNIIPLFSDNVIAILLSGQFSRTNNPPLPEYEQFTLGGYNSLRGYRERQFRTTQMLRISPEYRYLVTRKSRLYLFYDCAYFVTTNYPQDETENHFKDGYGVGAKFLGGIGLITLEYAVGEEREFMKGKIHLGIDTAF